MSIEHCFFKTFRNGHPAYGALTLALPFAPSVAASINTKERRYKTLILHMPIVQIWRHFIELFRISELQLLIAEEQKDLKTMHSGEGKKRRQQNIIKYETEINETKTDLQRFKIYAGMLESAPQVVLQLSILLKKI